MPLLAPGSGSSWLSCMSPLPRLGKQQAKWLPCRLPSLGIRQEPAWQQLCARAHLAWDETYFLLETGVAPWGGEVMILAPILDF